MIYIVLAPSFNSDESLKKIFLFSSQNLIDSSLSLPQLVHQVSSESFLNFLRYNAHKQANSGEYITVFHLWHQCLDVRDTSLYTEALLQHTIFAAYC